MTPPSISPALPAQAAAARQGFWLCLGLLLLLAAGKATIADSIDPDFFWHVRVADQLLAGGIGPVVDSFSFASSRAPWTPFSWLGELFMKLVFDQAGLRGVVVTHGLCSAMFLLLSGLMGLEWSKQRHQQPRYGAALLAVAGTGVMSLAFLSFRPVTFALVIMAAIALLLVRDRRTRDHWLWAIVPLVLLLTNLHLYVVLVLGWLGAMTLGAVFDSLDSTAWQRPRRLALLSALSTGAAACTPMLIGNLEHLFWFQSRDPMVRHALVAEIAPFWSGPIGPLLVGFVLIVLGLAWRDRKCLRWECLLWLAFSTLVLVRMGRFAPVFAIVALPMLGATFPRLPDRILGRTALRIAMAALLLIALVRIATCLPGGSTTPEAWSARNPEGNLIYPGEAAQFVERQVPRVHGRIFNELTWGGYLIWRLGDRYQVLMDGRTLIFPASFWETYYVDRGAAAVNALRGETADAAILPRQGSVLRGPLEQLGWQVVHEDANAVVLVPPQTSLADLK